MSGQDRDIILRSNLPSVTYLARAAVDADGRRLFTDRDISQLKNKSSKVVQRISALGFERNGLTTHSIERLTTRLRDTERRAYFAIARELKMTVSRFLRDATSEEISEWMALARIEAEERESNTPELDDRARQFISDGS